MEDRENYCDYEDGCDYDLFGDTRNRKGKIEEGYTSHNRGYKEQKRIYYAKEKRQMQSEEDKKKNEILEEEEEEVKSKKRVLKKKTEETDEDYGNNYTPIEKKNEKDN